VTFEQAAQHGAALLRVGHGEHGLPEVPEAERAEQGTRGHGPVGEVGGVESVTLTNQQMPAHNHAFQVSTSPGNQGQAGGNVLASPPVAKLYRAGTPSDPFPNTVIQPAGGNQPHENMQPTIVINYIISLYGIFPTQT
jgi:microcystin-dependent protein